MELQYIVLTIIKILISVPAIVVLINQEVDAAALIGGHVKNNVSKISRINTTDSYDFKIDLTDENSQEIPDNSTEARNLEEVPDPSPLIVPGYNLPENIFNRGKPFYLEKNPLTGSVDFESKTASLKVYDDYEYEDDLPYDKSQIDRKDGPISGGHKPSDINQLTPNFHDFLNLPVKYNPDKYVYPLISSSYANTKVQGNVNKQHNHKNYEITTYKPTLSPTYFTTKKVYSQNKVIEYVPKDVQKIKHKYEVETSTKSYPSTTENRGPNLMHSPMNHPSFNEEEYTSTITTTTTSRTTTKRAMSLFEQIFGSDYDDSTTETELEAKPTPPKLFDNLPSNKKSTTTQNILVGNMGYGVEEEDEYKEKEEIKTTTKKDVDEYEYEYDYQEKPTTSTASTTTIASTTSEIPTTATITNKKVTSLPLGENHVTHFHPVISTNNLREKLNAEKVPEQKYNTVVHPQAPSASNIHIAPDQDIVSFVVGNHQNVDGEGNGGFVGTSLKESPYDNNPFRPVYNVAPPPEDPFRHTAELQGNPVPVYNIAPPPEEPFRYPVEPQGYKVAPPPEDPFRHQVEPPGNTVSLYNVEEPFRRPVELHGSAVTIQPNRNAEASLAIGAPINEEQIKPGKVVDDQVENDYPKMGNKIIFPNDRPTTYSPDLSPPPPPIINREVLKLSSKPMFHQLPSDLTPPNEKEPVMPPRLDRDRVRPPWDPRPGHFHAGRPEYARPPRPVPELYKRIDNLPNILPQFRPNMKVHHSHPHQHHHHHHYSNKNYARQPLLDRPSNRPIGFFEKLHPPPLSKIEQKVIEDRVGHGTNKNLLQEPFAFLQAPPKVVVTNRRSGDDIETLQMIQAKKEKIEPAKSSISTSLNGKDTLEKPLYVVYPVNTPPLKLDVLDTGKKESVVIGTRAELPLPPSKIPQEKPEPTGTSGADFNYEINERHDAPILKPRPGGSFPLKTDFPYPLERPDPSILNPETVDEVENNLPDEPVLISSNQWNTIEDTRARIVNTPHTNQNQISVTLKTHTEKPIAVAYTPTESSLSKYTKDLMETITNKSKYQDYQDRFSMPNYSGLVIPEIRPSSNSEITVSAVMHARPQKLDRIDEGTTIPAQDFQAPFQASVHIDHSLSQGWSVVKSKEEHKNEVTTVAIATTSEFDIENFKPQLEGGFKPIYSFPEDQKDTLISEREE